MKSYSLKINNIDYEVGGLNDLMDSPPSARGFSLKVFERGLNKYSTIFRATEENGYGFLIYVDDDVRLILKGGQGSDHKQDIYLKNNEIQLIRFEKYKTQSDFEFLRKTCLSGRTWVINLDGKDYYFVTIWNTVITNPQYDSLLEYLKRFPKNNTYIQMGLSGTGPQTQFKLINTFVPVIVVKKQSLSRKEKQYLQTKHTLGSRLPRAYAKELEKLRSMTEDKYANMDTTRRYEWYKNKAKLLIKKLQRIKTTGKLNNPSNNIVTKSVVTAVMIGIGNKYPNLSNSLESLLKYAYDKDDLVKLHKRGKIDLMKWKDPSIKTKSNVSESTYYKKIWFTPDGRVVNAGDSHEGWIINNDKTIKKGASLMDTYDNAINSGYVRGIYDTGNGFLTLSNLPNYEYSHDKLKTSVKKAIENYIDEKKINYVASGKGRLIPYFDVVQTEGVRLHTRLIEGWRDLAAAAALGLSTLNGVNLQAAPSSKIPTTPNTVVTRPVNTSYTLDDIIASTLVDEAGGEKDSKKGMHAVLNVIMNRAKGDFKKAAQECIKPYQFSGWNKVDKKNRDSIAKFINSKKSHAKYKEALNLIKLAKAGKLNDIVNGANHFLNVNLTKFQRKNGKLPTWYDAKKITANVGKHQFLKLEGVQPLGEYFGFNYYI